MAEGIGKEKKKEVMKDILRKLHHGLSVEEAKKRFEREIGNVSSTEIAEIEQGLLEEGIPPDEIKKFCNVHALLFQSALEKSMDQEQSPAHPVYLMKQNNREIEKITGALKEAVQNGETWGMVPFKQKVGELLGRLKNLDIHYTWKEQILFPYLEKYEFYGPSKVMWGKDDEVRALLKSLGEALAAQGATAAEWKIVVQAVAEPALAAVEEMIYKEENILLPMSQNALTDDEWGEIWQQTPEYGYCLVDPREGYQPPKATDPAKVAAVAANESLVFPTGALTPAQIRGLFGALPLDLTFVDADDRVRYFSEGADRVFARSKAILGRKVQHCHPPKSVHIVEQILEDFKSGRRSIAEFWITLHGKFVHIRYFAVRDEAGAYQGTLEVTQDLTRLRALAGERRLLEYDEKEKAA